MSARKHTGQNQSQRSGGKLRLGFWSRLSTPLPKAWVHMGLLASYVKPLGSITVPLPYYPRREFQNDPFLPLDGPQPVGLQPVEDAWILGGSSFPFT